MNEFVHHRHSNLVKKGRYFHSKNVYFDFHWSPALSWSSSAYTLVYFLGYDSKLPQDLIRKNSHNLLCIVDRSGLDSKGSWFFGNQGEPTTLNFLFSFLNQFSEAKLLDLGNLIFAGKGMGAHIALYCQQKYQSKISVVHNPTINLLDSEYVQKSKTPLFETIFSSSKPHEFQDLMSLITNENSDQNEIFLTSDIETQSTRFLEQVSPLMSLSNVNDFGQEQLYFSSIFRLMDDRFASHPQSVYAPNRVTLPFLEENLQPIKVKVSSRPEYIINDGFDFHLDPYEDRSWRFWFQNLSWLEDHLESLETKADKEQQFDIIFSKWLCYITPGKGHDEEFFYHDHSLAYRAMHLINCSRYASPKTLPVLDLHIADIGTLLMSPLEDNTLSNHAYDQAVALFLVSHYLPESDGRKLVWEKTALDRLKRELEYSFTADGVHVENSPSYHHGMITNIHKSLTKVLKTKRHSDIQTYLEQLEKSIPFLRWIIRPDGKVPAIGDSEEKQVSTSLAREIMPDEFQSVAEGMRVFGDGYAIWRSEDKDFHLTLKSCQHGRFHRHDDDCSITLWSKGENLIHDAGLLYYKEKDPNRIFARSPQGHSGFEIPNIKPIRNMLDKNAKKAKVAFVSEMKATSTLGMYSNFKIGRTVETDFNKIVIEDRFCQAAIEKGVKQNFIVSSRWKIDFLKDRIMLSDKSLCWSFLVEDERLLATASLDEVLISKLKNKTEKAYKLSFTPPTSTTRITLALNDERPDLPIESKKMVNISHDKFGDMKLELPIDWSMNPHGSKNWMHHLNSLRWLGKNHPLEDIIEDFYAYHFVDKNRHPYFNTRAGDHTISIRLIKCCKMHEHASSSAKSLLEKIMKFDVSSLLKESVYRIGHNHGLMADVALLQASKISKYCSEIIDIHHVQERATQTLSDMFFQNGLTKEHSLSYQLWNLNYAIEYFLESSIESLAEASNEETFRLFSKEFIDHFLVDSTHQFPIGDSFRKLNVNLYEKVFTSKPLPVSGTYHNEQFSSVRYGNQYSQMVHATLVSGYNSHIHKQDDDLSFCLAIDGEIIIDDAGYTDTATAEEYSFLASTDAHSMLTLPGLEFLENQGKSESSVNPVSEIDGTYCLSGIHHRIPKIVIEREVLATDHGIRINDSVETSEKLESQIVKRRFVINPDFNFEILDTLGASITDLNGKEVLFVHSKDATFTPFSEGVYVGEDKRHTTPLKGFDVISDVQNLNTVEIDFQELR